VPLSSGVPLGSTRKSAGASSPQLTHPRLGRRRAAEGQHGRKGPALGSRALPHVHGIRLRLLLRSSWLSRQGRYPKPHERVFRINHGFAIGFYDGATPHIRFLSIVGNNADTLKETTMKTIALAVSLIALASGAALAAPAKYRPGHVSGYELAAIAKSAAQLAQIKKRAWADGRLSFYERMQIRNAEARHSALVARARHS